EHVAPSEQIAEDAASGLTEQLAENLPRQKRTEHLLTTFVRNDVTEESQRQRDDPAGRQAARKARSDERRQRPCEPPPQHQHGRHRGRCGHAGALAETVATGPMMSCTEPCASA